MEMPEGLGIAGGVEGIDGIDGLGIEGLEIPDAFLNDAEDDAPEPRSLALDEQMATDVTEVEDHAVKEFEAAGADAILDGPSAAQMDGRASDGEEEDDEGEEEDSDEYDSGEDESEDVSGDEDLPLPAEVAHERGKKLTPVPPATVTLLHKSAPFGSRLEADEDDDDFGDSGEEEDEEEEEEEEEESEEEEEEEEEGDTDGEEDSDEEEVDRAKDSSIRLSTTDISSAVRNLKPHPKYATPAAPVNPAMARALAKIQAEKAASSPPAPAAAKSKLLATVPAPAPSAKKSVTFAAAVRAPAPPPAAPAPTAAAPVPATPGRAPAPVRFTKAGAVRTPEMDAREAAAAAVRAKTAPAAKNLAIEYKAAVVGGSGSRARAAVALRGAAPAPLAAAAPPPKKRSKADEVVPLRMSMPAPAAGAGAKAKAGKKVAAKEDKDEEEDGGSVERAVSDEYNDQQAVLLERLAEVKRRNEAKARELAAMAERVAKETARRERERHAHKAAFDAAAALQRQIAEEEAREAAFEAEMREAKLSLAMAAAADEYDEEEAALTPAARKARASEAAERKALAAITVAERKRRRLETAHHEEEIRRDVKRDAKARAAGMEEAVRAMLEHEEKERLAALAAAAASKGRKGGDVAVSLGTKAPAAFLDDGDDGGDDEEAAAFLAKFLEEHGAVELEAHDKHVGWMNAENLVLKDDAHTVKTHFEDLAKTPAGRAVLAVAEAKYKRKFEQEEAARTRLKAKAMVRVDPRAMKEKDDAKDAQRAKALAALQKAHAERAEALDKAREEERQAKLRKEFVTWHLRDALGRLWEAAGGAGPVKRTFLIGNAPKAQDLCRLEMSKPKTKARLWQRFLAAQADALAASAAGEEAGAKVNGLREVRDALHARPQGPPRCFHGATSGVHLAAVSHALTRGEGPARNAADD